MKKLLEQIPQGKTMLFTHTKDGRLYEIQSAVCGGLVPRYRR